jgi:hypothetical protein
VTVELNADGANAAQVPELQLPVGNSAQVFAEPAQAQESFDGGRPHARITRKFSIVPAQAGTLHIPGPRMAWWDVRASVARTASLPDLNLQVAPGVDGFGNAPAQVARVEDTDRGGRDWIRVPGVQGEVRPWAAAAVLFAALWLLTLMWGLHRRPGAGGNDAHARQPARVPPPTASTRTLRDFRQALDTGDLGDVADILCAMAAPPVADLDALQARLDDATQRDAVAILQRARWGDGDARLARAALRSAFARGPHWRKPQANMVEPLPPLYPS